MGYDQKLQYGCIIILFLLSLVAAVSAEPGQKIGGYNRAKTLVLVEYASAVYIVDDLSLLTWTCSRCKGQTKGFKIHSLIIDTHCLQAFVGVAENLKAIVIAFRGTQDTSMQNWAEDLYFKELDLNYPGPTDATVHSGFYAAYHNTTLRERVLESVLDILRTRSDLSIMITGHSMGGAMATFCGLDLSANYGLKDIEVVTFGQPRVGNYAFAVYYNDYVPSTIRVTHAHDIVPHLPPYYSWLGEKTYHHFATEVWIYRLALGRLDYEFERVCDGSGEDTSCSRSVMGNSIADHLTYFGVSLRTEDDLTSDSNNTLSLGWGCKTGDAQYHRSEALFMQNWAEDLYFKELDLNYPGPTDATVHSGFYAAYHNTTLRERVLESVLDILRTRSDLSIMITGHSMGGAMATFCGLDLSANYGLKDIEVVTFGQPRVGNYAFAVYYNDYVPSTIRVTHAHDIVPHLPPYYSWLGEKTYHHFATEVWIYRLALGRLDYEFERVCDGSGEDTSCSRSVMGNSIADHLTYFGVSLRTEDDLTSDSNNTLSLGWGCKTGDAQYHRSEALL